MATDADEIGVLFEGQPTTLYIYLEAADARADAAGGGYWAAPPLRPAPLYTGE